MDNQKLIDMTIFQAVQDIRQMIITRNVAAYQRDEYYTHDRDIDVVKIREKDAAIIAYAIRDLYTMAIIEKPSPYYIDLVNRCVNEALPYANVSFESIKKFAEERKKEVDNLNKNYQPQP